MLLAFEGISRPIALIGSEDLVECFSAVLRGWRFPEFPSSQAPAPVITIRKTAKGYSLHSPWRPSPTHYRDRVDAVCSFTVDLIRAYIADDPSLLCLHCAAAVFAGKLVIMPNRYRAGKSTLSANLAAAGVRLFADDVLPIKERENKGMAPGIAPRLRLPLPDGASASFHDYVHSRWGLANERYLYLDLNGDELASLGAEAPIGGFVLLHRDPKARPALLPTSKSKMLRRVILQNFAREVQAVDILGRLHALVADTQCFTLHYSDGEQAVAVLKEAFGHWPSRPRSERPSRAASPAVGALGKGDGFLKPRFKRNPKVVETAVDHNVFLVNPDNQAIHQLNAIGAALWRLLAEPIGVEQAVGILHEAFPDVSKAQIERDVAALVADLAGRGLLIDSRSGGAGIKGSRVETTSFRRNTKSN